MSTTGPAGVRVEARLEEAGVLLVGSPDGPGGALARDFPGTVATPEDLASGAVDPAGRTVYLCGAPAPADERRLATAARVFTVREDADGAGDDTPRETVGPGRVPRRVHGLGAYYPRFFAPDGGHFDRIRAEHAFQSLTESTKPGTAHRSGIYLTPVQQDGDDLRFRLLRCSTNLSGPTENFGPTDTRIVDALNREADALFRDHAPLNHVLAQTYHNTPAAEGRKQTKARISAHADKTKDMPANGIMAFCTFYDGLDRLHPLAGDDPYDYGARGVSALTRLHFRRKETTGTDQPDGLPEQFTVTLHPGSVFFMPLSTNRRYAHEIRPAALDAELLPTRLGYVVRCSATPAVHRDGRTLIERAGELVELEPPTEAGLAELRERYAEENRSASFVDYGDGFRFSMNSGDYRAPSL
ncbi:hypothetical protein ACIQBJ_33445 [Kitasatospora sp. NPDC088391]|uniref:hypothetical protein n=1 Tax=Kitasatospora sp. NPDC088391 TaxID=3364074 RepID=UPI003812A1F0